MHVLKEMYGDFTNHGGLEANWTQTIMERIGISNEIDCLNFVQCLCNISSSQSKKIKELLESLEAEEIPIPHHQ